MKKLFLAFVTVTIVGIGSAPALAQVDSGPVDCIDQPSADPSDPCYNPAVYPPTTPASSISPPSSTEAPATSVDPPPTSNLPQTGSGISSTLGMGAILLLVGAVVVVAARRRSTASPAI